MLFKKKKYSVLDRGLFAEAITIHTDKFNLEDKIRLESHWFDINDIININEHLKVSIDTIWHSHGEYSNYYSMRCTTYVDDIKMASYVFYLDTMDNNELYRKWECKDKEIIHYMPNQFIDALNDWSNSIVSNFEKECDSARKEKLKKIKEKYENEELLLNKYR